MPPHSKPEILRTPIESVVLLMKSLGITDVSKFPFPTPPRPEDVEGAAKHLVVIGAIDRKSLRITPLGKSLLQFPVAPRYSKMITTAMKLKLRPVTEMVACMVAVASTTLDLFEHGTVQEAARKTSNSELRIEDQKRLLHSGSDLITFLRAVGVFSNRPTATTCQRFNIVHKTMVEANQLRQQLKEFIDTAATNFESNDAALDDDDRDSATSPKKMTTLDNSIFDAQGACILKSDTEILLRKIAAIGLTDQIARKATVHDCRIRNVPFTEGKTSRVPYLDVKSGSIVYIHPSSSVASTHPPPDFVAYCGLQRSRRGDSKVGGTRTFMKGVTSLAKSWLDDVGFDEEIVKEVYERPIGTF
jgi:ATP-dependent RNA helicase DHX37/DHR1